MVDYVDTINGTEIGGYIVDDSWPAWKGIYLVSAGTLNGNSTATYALSDLPNNGYGYMAYGWIFYRSMETNGNLPDVYIQNGKDQFHNRILFARVRSGADRVAAMSWRIYLPPDNHNLILRTANASAIKEVYIFWARYRRIGTNG